MEALRFSSKNEKPSPLTALFVIVFSMMALTGFTGCIDINFTKEVVERVQEEEEIRRADQLILAKYGEEFEVEFEGGQNPTAQDFQRVATKMFDNLSNPNQNTLDDLQLILHEENITLKSKMYDFFVVPDTDRIYVSVRPVFAAVGNPPVGGFFEITITNATDDVVEQKEVVQTENEKESAYNFFPPRTSISPGRWKVELRGTGLQSPGSFFYSGKFDLEVHAHEPV